MKLDLEYFCPGGERRGNGLRKNFVQEEGRNGVGLRIICPSKREKKSKVKGKARQKRSKESRPVSGKASYDRVPFPGRLQNNSMLPFPSTNKKKSLYQPWLATGANRKKARVRFSSKIFLCNSNGSYSPSAFISYLFDMAPQKRLVLITQSIMFYLINV